METLAALDNWKMFWKFLSWKSLFKKVLHPETQISFYTFIPYIYSCSFLLVGVFKQRFSFVIGIYHEKSVKDLEQSYYRWKRELNRNILHQENSLQLRHEDIYIREVKLTLLLELKQKKFYEAFATPTIKCNPDN